jgi:hypothetical protein
MWKQVPEDVVLFNTKEFFGLYVQGLIFTWYFHMNFSIFLFETCELQKHFFLVQHELLVMANFAIKLYYEEVPDKKFRSTSKL